MSIKKVNNLFSEEELLYFYKIIDNIKNTVNKDAACVYDDKSGFSISKDLGRLQFTMKRIEEGIVKKLIEIANSFSHSSLDYSSGVYVKYSSEYGFPNLPPHFDGDANDLIINYQISSNTSWDIGIDLETHVMEDNSALVFNPNKNIHWRPHKVFAEGEYVRMIFFRFQDVANVLDNSHLKYSSNHEIFKNVNEFRDSL
jgi:hypothetical protein